MKSNNIFEKFERIMTILVILFLVGFLPDSGFSEEIQYHDPWSESGFNLKSQSASGIEIVFSIEKMELEELEITGEIMHLISIPGVILLNDEGAPNLPGVSRFIAIPQGSNARVEIVSCRTEVFTNINLLPAPPIPLGNDDSPTTYHKNPAIYSRNVYFPESPVRLSEHTKIRGVDVVMIGITPFQYNPVIKELIVYRDLDIRIDFVGGNGHFGEDRLRNRYFEPILRGNILNYASLPQVNFNRIPISEEDNVEYLIIIPDDPAFEAWADSIKVWRNQQGIITGITRLSEIGGNDFNLIDSYINNAYHTWEIPPVAVLLLSDYQDSGDRFGITAQLYDSGAAVNGASDNYYADVDGNNLPDIILSRICAQNEEQLATIIGKIFDYERNPPTDPDFYEHPLCTGGWQTERWFILCLEVIWGYFNNELDKNPIREYGIYSGVPGNIWSSNVNTYMIVNYFGPNGLNYIPIDPSYLTDWSGSAWGINNAINQGAFIVIHRDHSMQTDWWVPEYHISDLAGLYNSKYPFVWSTGCNSGQFNNETECLAEAFQRSEYGALGVIAASSYVPSFCNDTYVWGMWDSFWPDFDPGYGQPGPPSLYPAFANAYGKYYLQASSWPYNPEDKGLTIYLFNHLGDAFNILYSEVPQELNVSHNPYVVEGDTSFTISATEGAIVSLTVNNTIIGVAEATGLPQNIEILPQSAGSEILVTATLVNYYRYIEEVYVIPSQGPYIVFNDVTINDSLGNNNGMINPGEAVLLSITLENVGFNPGVNIEATINTVEVYVSIIDSTENYGNIPPGLTSLVNNGFLIELTDNCPNDYILQFTINIADGDSNWISDFSLYTYPDIEITLEPHNMPIIIPCNGGSFSFDASIRNNGTSPANFSAWSAVILPDSTEFGPILTRLGINLASGDSISRDNINQNVPANAPAGIYYYGVYVGNDIGEALFEDGFEFEKSSTEIGRKGENSWNISGWETGDISSILVIPEDPVFNYNYPNPFNAETRFNFSLPEDMRISLAIYNIQGQDVAILLDEICPAGYHSIKFDGSQLANGIYFARFISDYGQKTVKLLLIK